METPLSLKTIAASEASISAQKTKKADSVSRTALSEQTNNSPIVGVAMEGLSEKTPKSLALKNKAPPVKNTPGSGESLLRGQVKSLLHKVDEEAEVVNTKIPFSVPMFAPTPANTPQILMEEGLAMSGPIKILDPVVPEQILKVQEETAISRALLFDSPDKSEVAEKTSFISSTVSYQNSEIKDYGDDEKEDGDEDESLDDVCAGLSKMTVQEKKLELPEFEGKHTRFVYNSDGEIEGEELIVCDKVVSPNAVILKGLPVPEGKHLRFQEEEEEERKEN